MLTVLIQLQIIILVYMSHVRACAGTDKPIHQAVYSDPLPLGEKVNLHVP